MQTKLAHFGAYLIENGYRDIRFVRDNSCWIGTIKLTFTCAIVIGRTFDRSGYEDRWCYHSEPAAKAALDAWDGVGEPKSWHRHPNSGRRVAITDTEISEDGKRVAVGAAYVWR
jgi:hypothetical protein